MAFSGCINRQPSRGTFERVTKKSRFFIRLSLPFFITQYCIGHFHLVTASLELKTALLFTVKCILYLFPNRLPTFKDSLEQIRTPSPMLYSVNVVAFLSGTV